jgi:hypothetical protein
MNPSDEDRTLTDAYRKASDKDAGGPGVATRNAILAEAAAAARRRKPAANDSRYLLRGVAGVAVLGIAVLLWQQVDHRMPGKETVVEVIPVLDEVKTDLSLPSTTAPMDAPMVAPAPAPAPATAPPRAAATDSARAPVPAEEKAESQSVAPAAVIEIVEPRAPAPPIAGGPPSAPPPGPPAPRVFGPPAPPAPPPPPAPAALRNESARAQAKMSADENAETDAVAMLQLHFPQQYQSPSPHRLWLVLDATGAALRSGELTGSQNLADLRLVIEGDLGGRLLRPWRIHTLRNARGQPIELAIAQTP